MLCPNVETLSLHIVIALYHYHFGHMGTHYRVVPLSIYTVKLVALSLLKVIAFGVLEQLTLLFLQLWEYWKHYRFRLRPEKRPKAIMYNAVTFLL
jgi:hypothetical protein